MKLRLSRNDFIVISVFLIIFVISLGSLFLFNFDIIFDSSKQERIGAVRVATNDVRQKFNSSYSWNKVDNDNQVNYGDQLFVGPKSSAIIELDNGGQMKVSENSLVKFEKKKNSAKLFVSYGDVKTDIPKGSIQLNICGEDHDIQSELSSVVSIQNSKDCKTFKIKADKGKVKISKKFEVIEKKKEAAPIKLVVPKVLPKVADEPFERPLESQDLAVTPTKTEPIVPVEPEVQLLPPVLKRVNDLVTIKHNMIHKIQWNPSEHAQKYKVTVSNNPEMKDPETYDTAETSLNFKMKDKETYYYTVTAQNLTKNLEATSQMGRFDTKYPEIVLDENIKKISFKAKNSKDIGKPIDVEAKWSPVATAQSYNLEVAKDKNFSEITQSIKTRKPSSTIEVPEVGQYYYRVHAYNSKGQKLTSSGNVGEIDYARNFDLVTPEIRPELKKLVLFFQKTNGQFIRLKWINPNKEKAPNMIIELADTPRFENIVKRYATTGQSGYSINESIPVGTYYWRVKAYNKESVSDWSVPAEIKIVNAVQGAGTPKASSETPPVEENSVDENPREPAGVIPSGPADMGLGVQPSAIKTPAPSAGEDRVPTLDEEALDSN